MIRRCGECRKPWNECNCPGSVREQEQRDVSRLDEASDGLRRSLAMLTQMRCDELPITETHA